MVENTIRVLLAEDHDLVRRGIRAMLAEYDEISVVGEASDGREVLKMVAELDPQVVVMDIGMPRLNGVETTRRLKRDRPEIAVVIVTMHSTETWMRKVLDAGARSFLSKNTDPGQLLEAIKHAAQGEYYLPPSVSKAVVQGYLSDEKPRIPSLFEKLTGREREILQLVGEGRNGPEIAIELTISIKTVETHRTNLMRKLDLHSVADLVRYAVRNGIVEVGSDELEKEAF